jgi:hypothetical protein
MGAAHGGVARRMINGLKPAGQARRPTSLSTSNDRLKVRGRLSDGRSGVATTQTTSARDGGGGSTSRTHEYAVTAADAAAARAGETAPRAARSLPAAILFRYLQRGRSAGLGTSHRTRARRLSAWNRCSPVQWTRRGDTKLGGNRPSHRAFRARRDLHLGTSSPRQPDVHPLICDRDAASGISETVRTSLPLAFQLSATRERGGFAAGPPRRLRAFDWRC